MFISFFFLLLHDKIYKNITIQDIAKIYGYTPEAIAKTLKALYSHPVRGSWRKHRKTKKINKYKDYKESINSTDNDILN